MKLTEELKQKVDYYFNNLTEEEIKYIRNKYFNSNIENNNGEIDENFAITELIKLYISLNKDNISEKITDLSFINKYKDLLNWEIISSKKWWNDISTDFLNKFEDYIYWNKLNIVINDINLIERHISDGLTWENILPTVTQLNKNDLMKFIDSVKDKISWDGFEMNKIICLCDDHYEIIKKYSDHINWNLIQLSPNKPTDKKLLIEFKSFLNIDLLTKNLLYNYYLEESRKNQKKIIEYLYDLREYLNINLLPCYCCDLDILKKFSPLIDWNKAIYFTGLKPEIKDLFSNNIIPIDKIDWDLLSKRILLFDKETINWISNQEEVINKLNWEAITKEYKQTNSRKLILNKIILYSPYKILLLNKQIKLILKKLWKEIKK